MSWNVLCEFDTIFLKSFGSNILHGNTKVSFFTATRLKL